MDEADNRPGPAFRAVSFVEFLIGGAIVVAHNVYHAVPNEVPILFVLGWLSLRLRDGGLSASGLGRLVPQVFRRSQPWWKTILFAVVTAALLQLDNVVLDPVTSYFWPQPADLGSFKQVAHNLPFAAQYFALIWTFAAFGEELSYRGYLMRRAADIAGGTRAAWWLGMIVVSVLFGLAHWYKGPPGVLDSTVSGLILGSAYLLSGRNVWVTILAHGLSDTFALVVLFLGLAS